MEHIGTAKLKNNLSITLKQIQAGKRFVVTDHGKPVALMIPVDAKQVAETNEEILLRLAKQGTVTLPTRAIRRKPPPLIKLKTPNAASRALQEDRESW